jgi:adenylate cyclase
MLMRSQPGQMSVWSRARATVLKQIGPIRLAVTLLFLGLALLFARFGWSIPLNMEGERALYDVRVILTAPQGRSGPRIAMVVFNDETLKRVEKRSPLDRKTLADALRAIDGMKPKAIGIDILIDQPQAEDPELIETFRSMKTPTYLAYANNATNPEQIEVWQEEFLTRFMRPGGRRRGFEADQHPPASTIPTM